MTKTIHTQLQVSLLDKVSGPMKKVLDSNRKLSRQIKKTSEVLEKARGPLKLVKDFKKQNAALTKAYRAYQETSKRVQEMAAKISAAARPTRQMRAEMEKLRGELSRAGEKLRQQQEKVRPLVESLRRAGYAAGHLSDAEKRLEAAANRANRILGRQLELTRKITKAREQFRAGLEKNLTRIGGGYGLVAAGRAGLTALASPVRTAVSFEDAFTGVRKRADFKSKEEENAYRKFILDLSTKIPIRASGLAEIAASGFESGIRDIEENKQFTAFTAMAASAWDVDAATAGEALATMKAQRKFDMKQLIHASDVINELSNNMNLNALKLIRYVSQGGMMLPNLKSHEALALGATMIAQGAAPEKAYTAANKIFTQLSKGKFTSKEQRKAFAMIGLRPEHVAKTFAHNPLGTFKLILKQIRKLPEHLREGVASKIFGEEAQALKFLLRGEDPIAKLNEALQIGSSEKVKGSVRREFDATMESPGAKFRRLYNHFERLSYEIGVSVLPALTALAEAIKPYVEGLANLVRTYPKVTAALLGMAAAGFAAKIALGAIGMIAGIGGLVRTGAGYGWQMLKLGRKSRLYGRVAERLTLGGAKGAKGAGLFTRARAGLGRLWRFAPLNWARLIPPIPWARLAGRLSWGALIKPLSWAAARFIPPIAWASLAKVLVWDMLIKPLGWDKYIWQGLDAAWNWVRDRTTSAWNATKEALGQIDWLKVATFGLPGAINEIVKAFTGIDLFDIGKRAMQRFWDGLKSIFGSIKSWWGRVKASFGLGGGIPKGGDELDEAAAGLGVVRKKAVGGWMRPGIPTLVGERGPELLYPSRAAWVAHNENVRRLARMAAAASVAGALYYAPPAPAVAAPAQAGAGGAAPVVQRTVHVTVQPGAIRIHAAGMGADQLSDELGRRLTDTLRATMADVEDAG